MSKKTRIKAKALDAPQTKEECALHIHRMGELQRDLQRQTAAMNDAIAEVTKAAQPTLEELKLNIDELQKAVQTWCESHRAELTNDGRVKTANLVTGEVSWRQRPPSVMVRGADAVMDTLKRLGLGRFIRVKEEVNKEAILNEPEQLRGVAGLSVVTGVEDFIVTPFEQEAA